MADAFDRLPDAAPASATGTMRPGAIQPNYNRTILPDIARATTNAAPGIGSLLGMMGGAALGGPPGAMLGAYGGGKAGEWARYGLAPSVGLPQEVPGLGLLNMSDMANVALAGLGVGGKALGEAAAPGMMRTGLRMPPTWRQEWLGTVSGGELPEQAALRLKTATPEAAASVKAAAGKAQGAAVNAAERRGTKITVEQLAQAAIRNAERELKRSLTADEKSEFLRRYAMHADALLNEAAGLPVRAPSATPEANPFTPRQVSTVKRMAQKASKAEVNRGVQGASPIGQSDARLLAIGSRQALKRLPGVGKATLESQKARLLLKSLNRAAAVQQTSLPQLAAGGLGAGVGGALGSSMHGALGAGVGAALGAPLFAAAGHALASPEAQRQFALALMDPMVQRILMYGPLAGSIPARMLMTPQAVPPDTLPPNPAWGGGTP